MKPTKDRLAQKKQNLLHTRYSAKYIHCRYYSISWKPMCLRYGISCH